MPWPISQSTLWRSAPRSRSRLACIGVIGKAVTPRRWRRSASRLGISLSSFKLKGLYGGLAQRADGLASGAEDATLARPPADSVLGDEHVACGRETKGGGVVDLAHDGAPAGGGWPDSE